MGEEFVFLAERLDRIEAAITVLAQRKEFQMPAATPVVEESSDKIMASLLKLRDAARLLAVSERTLCGLAEKGLIPTVRIGRAVRYSRRDLEAWVVAQSARRSNQETTGG